MKKFYNKLWDWLPALWGVLLLLVFTFGGLALTIVTIEWFLRVVGVL